MYALRTCCAHAHAHAAHAHAAHAHAVHVPCSCCPLTRCPGCRGAGTPCDGSRANSWARASRASRARSVSGTSGRRLQPKRWPHPRCGGGTHGAAQHGTADAPTLRPHRPRRPRRLRRLHCRAAQPVARVVVWEPPPILRPRGHTDTHTDTGRPSYPRHGGPRGDRPRVVVCKCGEPFCLCLDQSC